ncbi:putative thioesterase [Caldicellulosiruptor bescii]|uniref:Thioesterase superfamily protein n=2 Tax=Caldicellulosiruptor bescii TaxID=31899 RepID=B9MM60_CALBD|nr:thioesterase family protein [Caldicellulosiruptor bescii]ACM61283.1 thioesterase superfamily protein [Caldicellulosiruptor bescii DSM 6725]PBC88904.1 putative thioesterase [Caldicellulosiruptor bescii]PBC91614.1 putative thioesterase [Caldicellulosiruptor bescii]PBD02973.1 putative thioesterase [Caldicellulosiruptor bescii]PBD07411.1 putative thioesterase [Caldicellulosiruptor bescii]
MKKPELQVGLKFKIEEVVSDNMLASHFQSGFLDVFATPSMIALMENAALLCVENYLEEGYTTVGSKVDVLHLAPTPKGMKVKAVAQLIAIEDRKLTFKVEAYDSFEKIGEGFHERFIVNRERFLNKAYQKVR